MKKWILVFALSGSALLAQNGPLANGIYAIAEGSRTAESLVVRQHEGKAIVLDTANFAPLTVAGRPELQRGPGGSALHVQLTSEAAKRLEELTRSQMNRPIAVVVGDRVLSAPKVRSVITDGKAMLTPCEDDSCTALVRELSK